MSELNELSLLSDANLNAYYRMESGALTTDSSGDGRTLTNVNSVGEGIGIFNGAADLGSSNTNKRFYRGDTLGLSETNFSLGLWFKSHAPISSGSFGMYSLSFASVSTSHSITYQYNSGNPLIALSSYRYGVATQSITYNFNAGTDWVFVGERRTAGNLYLMVNGVEVDSISATNGGAASPPFGNEFTLGATDTFSVGNFSSVLLDDVFAFSRSLTSQEWLDLYAHGVASRQSPMFFSGGVTLG